MPLVDVTFDPALDEAVLQRLAADLLDVVAEGVECTEEPWTGPPGPGDIEVRFRPRHPLDVGELPIVIEVRTRHRQSRAGDAQRRADLMIERLRTVLDPLPFGVWLILHDGAWSQSI